MTSSQNDFQTSSHTYTPIPKLFKQDKILIEEKGESLTFSQKEYQSNLPDQSFLTPRTSNVSIGIDKEKLYETFVLFHNFMNMTQTNTPNPPNCPMNTSNTSLQRKIEQIYISKSQESTHQNEEKVQFEVPQISLMNNRNYDDIPIKRIHGNFIDLVEKNLLIDKPDDNNIDKSKEIKREPSKDKIASTTPKLYKAYKKPFYSSTLAEERFSRKKFKPTSTQKRFELHKSKDKQTEKETPRRVMSNMKYEQMSKSLRKTNTDFHPYMTLTNEDIAIQNKLDKSRSKDDDDNHHQDKEQSFIAIPKEMSVDSDKDLSKNNESEQEKSKKIKNKDGGDEHVQLKNEESFHIITEMNANTKENIHINQPNEDFSNEEDNNFNDKYTDNNKILQKENQKTNQEDFTSNDNINHHRNTPSIEIEPLQLNNIPISSKLFQPTPIINQFTDQNYDKKLQNLNQEIQIFQEERKQILILKEEYENLHHRLDKEINELTTQKAKFEKWKEEEVKRIQTEKKINDKDRKIANELKRENQILKTNELNYKNQIEKLLIQIKELKKERKEKEKENIKLINSQQTKQQNTSSSSKSKNLPNTQRNNQINTTKLLKQQIPKDISFSTPSQNTSISNYNTNIAKKSVPKPIQQNANHSLLNKENYDLAFPEEYTNKKYELIREEKTIDGKEIKWYTNDKKEIIFSSGVRKELYNDGFQVVFFPNGDIKQVHKSGKTVYYFKEAKTIQNCFDNGLQVFKFQNGQIEKHFSDGKKEIFFVDGSYRIIRNNGSEETFFSDGTIQKINSNNVVTIETPSNSKEILITK